MTGSQTDSRLRRLAARSVSTLKQDGTFWTLLRFAIIGGVNGTVYAATYLAVSNVFGLQPFLASASGYLAGLMAGFLLHRNFTFLASGRVHMEFFRYLVAQAVILGVLSIVAQIGARSLPWPTWVVIASGILLAPPMTFVLLRFWVFRKSASV